MQAWSWSRSSLPGSSARSAKTATVRIDDTLYEVDLSLRALEVQLRFDPYRMSRIEVYYRRQSHGLARLVDLHLNSQLDGSQHYDR